jgi:hypothetical protein
MSGFKKYIVTWTEEHRKEVNATSKDNAITDVIIFAEESTCINSKNFKVEE